jgi:hypothetical protein
VICVTSLSFEARRHRLYTPLSQKGWRIENYRESEPSGNAERGEGAPNRLCCFRKSIFQSKRGHVPSVRREPDVTASLPEFAIHPRLLRTVGYGRLRTFRLDRKKIAEGRPEFGRPSVFADHIEESKWISITTTLHDPNFLAFVRDLTGNVPGEGG